MQTRDNVCQVVIVTLVESFNKRWSSLLFVSLVYIVALYGFACAQTTVELDPTTVEIDPTLSCFSRELNKYSVEK